MSSDEVFTTADFEAFGRGLLSQVGAASLQGAAEADSAAAGPRGTVTVSDDSILLDLVKQERRHSDPNLNELHARRAIEADREALLTKHADAIAVKKASLQAAADRGAEQAQAQSVDGRAAAAQVALRAAARKTEQAREYAALLTHEGQLPPGGLELLSEDEIIRLGQKPRERSPIEVADPTYAGRPPGANQHTVADDANDVPANLAEIERTRRDG